MSREKGFFSQDDLEFLSGLASQAAIAIANARLHEEGTRRATRLETLQRLTRKMNENLDLPEILAAITAGSAELLEATRVVVLSVDRKTKSPSVIYKHGLSDSYVTSLLAHFKKSTIPKSMKSWNQSPSRMLLLPNTPCPIEWLRSKALGLC